MLPCIESTKTGSIKTKIIKTNSTRLIVHYYYYLFLKKIQLYNVGKNCIFLYVFVIEMLPKKAYQRVVNKFGYRSKYMSHDARKPSSGFLTKPDTNQPIESLKQTKCLNFLL